MRRRPGGARCPLRAPRERPVVAARCDSHRERRRSPSAAPSVIHVHDLSKTYSVGEIKVHALRGRLAADRARRLRRDHGQLRQRQEHADEHPRLPGRAHERALSDRRHRCQSRWTRTTSPTCATARSGSSSRASTSCRARARSPTSSCRSPTPVSSRAERRRRAERALRRDGHGRPAAPPALRAVRRPAAARRGRPRDRHQPALILADEPTGNLDSHSTEDVLAIFARLNDEGRTVVLITHEPDVAAQAKRVIRLSDGEIVEDERARRARRSASAQPEVRARPRAPSTAGAQP